MNKLRRSHEASHKQVVNKLLMSHEQFPTVVILRLETGKSTIPGGCMPYAVWWFPPAGDWLAGAWTELGN